MSHWPTLIGGPFDGQPVPRPAGRRVTLPAGHPKGEYVATLAYVWRPDLSMPDHNERTTDER